MKKLVILFVLPAILLSGLASCGKKATGPIPTLDVTASYPEKELILQDIATVEYIPLETGDDFLLASYPKIHYIDDDIIVTNNKTHIMFFDRKTGKGLTSFSRAGRGPGEYQGIGSIAVDRKAGEMFLTENWYSSSAKSPMHVYNLSGKHIRTIELSEMNFKNHFHIYDDSSLFFYYTNIENPNPYKLLSRTDTTYTFLPVSFPDRDNMDVRVEMENGFYTTNYSGTTVLKTSEGYIFSEPGVDTIYSWNRSSGELTPLLARTPTFASMEFPVAISIEGQSSDYLFIDINERKRYERGEVPKYNFELLYDKTDGQFYESSLLNGDYTDECPVYLSSIESNQVSYRPGQFVETFEAYQLVGKHEKGLLQGPLAEIAATLKEDDNPVLMIATFK